MEIVIIDNQASFCKILLKKVESYFSKCQITIINNNFSCLFNKYYNICFIDIKLGKENGLTLAHKYLEIYPKSLIVFVSNGEEIIFDAQEVNMFMFIRKIYLEHDFSTYTRKYSRLEQLNNYSIEILVDRSKIKIFIKDIEYIQVNGNYCFVYTKNNNYKTHISMKKLFEKLMEVSFCKINNYEILNFKYIDKIQGDIVILFKGSKFKVNSRRIKKFKDNYYQYLIDNEC